MAATSKPSKRQRMYAALVKRHGVLGAAKVWRKWHPGTGKASKANQGCAARRGAWTHREVFHMARRQKKSKRRSYRRRSNAWRGSKRGHRKAALKGLRRRRRRNSSRRSSRRNRRNPGIVRAIAAPFNVSVLRSAAVMAGGAVGTTYVSSMVRNLGFMPSMLREGIGSYVVGLGSAGLLSAGVGMVSPKLAGQVLAGGVMGEVARALKAYVLPMIGMSGLSDYLTPGNAAAALSLGYMNDYLTPGNAAAAISLGSMTGDDTVGEELAAFA